MKGVLPDLCPLEKPSHHFYLSYTLSYLLVTLRKVLMSDSLKSHIDQVVLPTEADVSMPFTGVQFGSCRNAGTLTDEQDTVQCC